MHNNIKNSNQLNEIGSIRRKKEEILAKLGQEKAKRKMRAQAGADSIMKKWEEANITPTLPNIIYWLVNNNVNSSVIRAALKGIGITNREINKYIPVKKNNDQFKITAKSTPDEIVAILRSNKYNLDNNQINQFFQEAGIDYNSDKPIGNKRLSLLATNLKKLNIKPHNVIIDEWNRYKKEAGAPKTPTVKMVRDFIKDKNKDISDKDIGLALMSSGAKNIKLGSVLSQDVAEKTINSIFNKINKTQSNKKITTDVIKQRFNNENIPLDKQEEIFNLAGVDLNTNKEINKDDIKKLTQAKNKILSQVDSPINEIFINVSKVYNGKIKKRNLITQAQEVVRNNGKGYSELQKLGAAFILANKGRI